MSDTVCVFAPASEPWGCTVHGGYRTALDQTECSEVALLKAYDNPLTPEEEAEARAWVAERRGKPGSRGMLLAIRLLATLDAVRAHTLDLDSPETVERLARALRDITGAGDYVGVTDEEWSRRAARVLAALREGTA